MKGAPKTWLLCLSMASMRSDRDLPFDEVNLVKPLLKLKNGQFGKDSRLYNLFKKYYLFNTT